MNSEWFPQKNRNQLSVRVVSALLFWYLALWAGLTVATVASQALGISFRFYLRLSVVFSAVVLVAAALSIARSFRTTRIGKSENDLFILLGMLAAFIAVAVLSLAYHTKGRLFLDDFYLTANPVFYSQHAQAPMSFESRTFYSGGPPIMSVGFVTAGAYEHILAIPSYLLKVDYLLVYYRGAAVLNAFLLVLSVYFTIVHFSDDTAGALAGTLVVLCLLIVMSESSWAIGGLAFIHGYEGKAILILIGLPLFVAYALDFVGEPNRSTWLQLFLLVTAMTGMSTSSFMILPLLGFVIFPACMLTYRERYPSVASWMRPGLLYLAAFSYLVIFAALVSLADKPGNAILFNLGYPDNFYGYLRAYFSTSTWPATPVLALLIWAAAILLLKRRKRTFVLVWFALSIILLLNPLSARILLVPFRGIYFRLFYLIFHPLLAGVITASIFPIRTADRPAVRRSLALIATTCVAFAPAVLSPTSILLSPRYSLGDWMPTDDFPAAQKIVNNVPEGLMLAPYPLSGAVRMISSNYPQLEARNDILSAYLGLQGRSAEADLRVQANDFLNGNSPDFAAFAAILERYPGTRSIVFSKNGFAGVDSPALDNLLASKGFTHHQAVEKYVAYWR